MIPKLSSPAYWTSRSRKQRVQDKARGVAFSSPDSTLCARTAAGDHDPGFGDQDKTDCFLRHGLSYGSNPSKFCNGFLKRFTSLEW